MYSPILLEAGHNTSGIYSIITSLFYCRSESINHILNSDITNIGTAYIQEYIKNEIIGRLQFSKSMPVYYVNRFRYLLLNYGWKKEYRNNLDKILEDTNPIEIYGFLFSMFDSDIVFERIDQKNNDIDIFKINSICVDVEKHINHNEKSNEKSDNNLDVVDLSELIRGWVSINIVDTDSINYSYHFKEIPYIIPISINNPNKKYIDIKHSIGFNNINDPIQKIFTWDFQSGIFYDDEDGRYKSIVVDADDIYVVSENTIPSNIIIDKNDHRIIQKITSNIVMVFYKIK